MRLDCKCEIGYLECRCCKNGRHESSICPPPRILSALQQSLVHRFINEHHLSVVVVDDDDDVATRVARLIIPPSPGTRVSRSHRDFSCSSNPASYRFLGHWVNGVSSFVDITSGRCWLSQFHFWMLTSWHQRHQN